MPEERRYQKQRDRLRDQNGKAVTVHLPSSVLRYSSSIIEWLSEKDDQLTMRDAICLAITAFGDRIEFVHSQSKAVRRKAGETDAQKERRDELNGIRKECRDKLITVRASYPKIPRGRRPKGWTPPPPKLTPEEKKRKHDKELMEYQEALKEIDAARAKERKASE